MTASQLTLGLSLRDDATFNNFHPGNNENIVPFLKSFVMGYEEPFIYLWGRSGVGRSHLLQACCHIATEKQLRSIYLPLQNHVELEPAVLEGIETIDLICIDDIQCVLKTPAWEEALFHCYNRAREKETRLLVVGDVVPNQLSCNMPDLRSRLSSGLTLTIEGLDDQQKLAALQMRSLNRGIELTTEVAQFLMRHYPRDAAAIFTALEILDEASMREQRRVTIPFVKQVLNV